LIVKRLSIIQEFGHRTNLRRKRPQSAQSAPAGGEIDYFSAT
jgi:hypothetical protein